MSLLLGSVNNKMCYLLGHLKLKVKWSEKMFKSDNFQNYNL